VSSITRLTINIPRARRKWEITINFCLTASSNKSLQPCNKKGLSNPMSVFQLAEVVMYYPRWGAAKMLFHFIGRPIRLGPDSVCILGFEDLYSLLTDLSDTGSKITLEPTNDAETVFSGNDNQFFLKISRESQSATSFH